MFENYIQIICILQMADSVSSEFSSGVSRIVASIQAKQFPRGSAETKYKVFLALILVVSCAPSATPSISWRPWAEFLEGGWHTKTNDWHLNWRLRPQRVSYGLGQSGSTSPSSSSFSSLDQGSYVLWRWAKWATKLQRFMPRFLGPWNKSIVNSWMLQMVKLSPFPREPFSSCTSW